VRSGPNSVLSGMAEPLAPAWADLALRTPPTGQMLLGTNKRNAAFTVWRPQNNRGLETPRTANSDPSPLFSVSFVSFCSPHRRQRSERRRRELGPGFFKVLLGTSFEVWTRLPLKGQDPPRHRWQACDGLPVTSVQNGPWPGCAHSGPAFSTGPVDRGALPWTDESRAVGAAGGPRGECRARERIPTAEARRAQREHTEPSYEPCCGGTDSLSPPSC
jgi:hypothetical protein